MAEDENTPWRMFIPAMVDDAGLKGSEFRVLARIARRGGSRGQCTESVPNMAAGCGQNPKTTKAAIRTLIERGMIRRVARSGDSSAYELLPPPWQSAPSPKKDPGTKMGRVTSNEDPGQSDTRGRPELIPDHPAQTSTHEGIPLKGIQGRVSKEGIAPAAAAADTLPGIELAVMESGESRLSVRNYPLDALATVDGSDVNEVTDWGRHAKALATIRDVMPAVSADEISARATNYRLHFPNQKLTSLALAKHWSTCRNPPVEPIAFPWYAPSDLPEVFWRFARHQLQVSREYLTKAFHAIKTRKRQYQQHDRHPYSEWVHQLLAELRDYRDGKGKWKGTQPSGGEEVWGYTYGFAGEGISDPQGDKAWLKDHLGVENIEDLLPKVPLPQRKVAEVFAAEDRAEAEHKARSLPAPREEIKTWGEVSQSLRDGAWRMFVARVGLAETKRDEERETLKIQIIAALNRGVSVEEIAAAMRAHSLSRLRAVVST